MVSTVIEEIKQFKNDHSAVDSASGKIESEVEPENDSEVLDEINEEESPNSGEIEFCNVEALE